MSQKPDDFLKSQKDSLGKYYNISVTTAYLNGILLILQYWVLATIVNGIIFKEQDIREFLNLLPFMFLIFVLRFIFASISERTAFLGAQRVKKALFSNLYNRLQNLGPLFITSQGSGALVNSLTEGVEKIEEYYSQFLPANTLMSLLPLCVLVVVLPVDWISGLVLVFTAPLIPVFMILIGKGAEDLNQRQWKKLARMSNHFLDVVQGLTTLKLFNAARREGAMISKISEEYRHDTMTVLRLAFLSSVTLEFFATVSIAVVAVLIGFRLMWGDIAFFNGLFVLLLAPEFYLPLRKMGAAYHARMEAIGAVDKIIEIMNAPISNHNAKGANTPLKISAGIEISFRNVGFSYEEGKSSALDCIDFDIINDQKVALIGASGSGKSTIFSLLLGFITPQSGTITINGVSMADLDIDSWRSQISWIPQSPTLFHGNVLDNIRMGKPDATTEQIVDLCKNIGIDSFILALPDGYNTKVGEKGYGLSGGEIQRIAIARAFLRDAPFIMMDEPTASLDRETENILQNAMHNLCKGKSVLTIAHRLNTIKNADLILHMHNGKIIERGTHDHLYSNSAVYARLIDYDMPYTEALS